MNELSIAMSADMGINRFCGESEDSFIYRLCYSALGQWCLGIAQNSSSGIVGSTKHNQTIVLNDLMQRYSEIFFAIVDRFVDIGNQRVTFPVHIRRVYEESGYLLTDENNRNRLAHYGRCIPIGNTSLFFGVPNLAYTMNGLGIFTSFTGYKVSAKEFLIRDDLSCEEYYQSQFNVIDFYDRDINLDELEFFNPLSTNVPSNSWKKQMETDCTVARKSELGPYYRVRRLVNGSLFFADEPVQLQSDSFTSYEYRRLYFALKAHYGNPLKALVMKQDLEYSIIKLCGYLPNREYYFLLLLSWPLNNAFDKVNFLIKNEFIPEITTTLKNLGIEIKGGDANAQLKWSPAILPNNP